MFGGGGAYLEVEVGTAGGAGVAAVADGVAPAEAYAFGEHGFVDAEAFAGVLFFAHPGGDAGFETLQVGVDRGGAVGVVDVEGVSVAGGGDAYAGDGAVLHAAHGSSLDAARLYVHPGVEVGGAQFSEVSAEEHRSVQRREEALRQGGGQGYQHQTISCRQAGNAFPNLFLHGSLSIKNAVQIYQHSLIFEE